jgi:uncharacterized protein
MKKLLLNIVLLLPFVADAQDLPRRSFLGVQMENITDDVKKIMGIQENYGVLINGTVPGSSAEAAGFKKGDILLSINGQQLPNVQEAVSIVAAQKRNSEFSYELIRDKKKVSGRSTFKPYPTEKYAGIITEYAEVRTATGIQRMIITRPEDKAKHPVVIFIGGIGCYSLDMPFDSTASEVQLLNKLTRSGFIVARVEKPGMGDGAGYSKKCSEITFTEEKDVYVQAIKDLRQRSDVQPESIHIIGHSMGGVMAPLVAMETPVKGIVAYGTIGSNFIEYLLKTRRTIGEAYNWSMEETDTYVKDACECASYYFIEKMTTAEAAKKKQICGDYLSVFDLRSRKYNDELYAFNFPTLWTAYTGKALLLWGKSDFISAREDHEILAKTVNRAHPGNATLAYVDNADHGMNYATSFSTALNSPGKYNPAVGDTILAWLKANS